MNHFFDGEIRRIDDDGIVRCSKRRSCALAILLIALNDFSVKLIEIYLLTAR